MQIAVSMRKSITLYFSISCTSRDYNRQNVSKVNAIYARELSVNDVLF